MAVTKLQVTIIIPYLHVKHAHTHISNAFTLTLKHDVIVKYLQRVKGTQLSYFVDFGGPCGQKW